MIKSINRRPEVYVMHPFCFDRTFHLTGVRSLPLAQMPFSRRTCNKVEQDTHLPRAGQSTRHQTAQFGASILMKNCYNSLQLLQ